MLERIDPKLHRPDARAVSASGERQPDRGPSRGPAAPPRAAETVTGADQVDEALARLAAVIADVERLARSGAHAPQTSPPSPADVAARIARDGAAALAAQAGLGPTGVRLVLEARPPPLAESE